jgi:hypothetical protein
VKAEHPSAGKSLLYLALVLACLLFAGWFGLSCLWEPKSADSVAKRGTAESSTKLVDELASNLAGSASTKSAYTPENAAKELLEAKSIKSVLKRMAACAEIIGRLCEAGYTEEAWGLIDNDPGQVRGSQLLRYFKVSSLNPAQFVEKLVTLPFKQEENTALRGYLDSFDTVGTKALLENTEFRSALAKLEEKNPGLLRMSLASVLQTHALLPVDASLKNAVFDAARDYFKSGWIDENGLALVLKVDKIRDNFVKWEALTDAVPTAPAGSIVSNARKELVEGMVDEDADKALGRVTARGSDKQGHVDLYVGLKKWGQTDTTAANRWFAEHKAGMDQVQLDASARAFFELALTYGEPDGAEQWAQQVSNQRLKDLLLAKLPSKTPPDANK